MSRKKLRNTQTEIVPQKTFNKSSFIQFGEPEPVLTNITDYTTIYYDNQFDAWQIPINRMALAEAVHLNGWHGGVLYSRVNQTKSTYITGGLTDDQIESAIYNYITFGDLAILKVRNQFGYVVELYPLPSIYLRRKKDGRFVILQQDEPLIYDPQDIIFIKQYDPRQDFYGLPDYIGGLNSALLNTEATIFRRRYYNNGAHMGFILYSTDANMTDEMEQEVKSKIEHGKGLGNFKSLFINIPKGDPEGIKLINVGEMGAKDEFSNIKSITAQDILTAHRYPAGLAGIIPQGGAIMGDPEKARSTYRKDEVFPIIKKFINAVKNDPEVPAHLHLQFDLTEFQTTSNSEQTKEK